MHYAMLVYLNEPAFQAMSEAEQLQLRNDCADWYDALTSRGHGVDCMRLQPVATATTLRENQGKLVLFDGPFAETKEVLAGLAVLDCQDLDQAVALSRTFPSLAAGFSVELRPIIPQGAHRADPA